MDAVTGLGMFVAGAGVTGLGAGLAWALSETRRLAKRVATLEAQAHAAQATPPQLPADAWSVVALLKLTSRDNLDALTRLSPEAALAVVRELMPQLFTRQVG